LIVSGKTKRRRYFLLLISLSLAAAFVLVRGPVWYEEFHPELKEVWRTVLSLFIDCESERESMAVKIPIKDVGAMIFVPDGVATSHGLLRGFYIGKYETTVWQFREYYDETKPKMATFFECAHRIRKWFLENDTDFDHVKLLPMVGVTYEKALDYCRWAGLRLCKEEEWEAVCCGKMDHLYPYGSHYDESRCKVDETNRYPGPVGQYPDCVGPLGVHDMIGNAYEWVDASANPPKNGYGVLRGGDMNNEERANCSFRYIHSLKGTSDSYGFRCCADVRPTLSVDGVDGNDR
jgi:hypothetical protein